MTKVTDEELKEIHELRDSLAEIVTMLGEQHLNKFIAASQLQIIEETIKQQEKRFVEFQNTERVLFEKLQQKYGAGDINMETGEVTE